MRARQMIVFFRISVYNFRLSGIVLCPFVLTQDADAAAAPEAPLRRLATPPAGEADEAPPPLSCNPLKRNKTAK